VTVPVDAFREVMAGVATPVAVVTTLTGDGPHGTTVSSFASLSLAPPMVMAALDRSSGLLSRLVVGAPFGVNVLGSHQAELAGVFARRGGDKFAGVEWSEHAGAPRLAGCPAGSPARSATWSPAATTSSCWPPSCTPRRAQGRH
jgi:flavin reductase (DIM6/NTAB) family NADH-FMN oxidoreductase RutF